MAHPKVEYNYLQKIIEFNSDKDIIALREKYKEPTFFEIISKQRSETTYSSFLKWMFQSSSTDLSTVSPILLLLDVLVQRSQVQEKETGDKINLIDQDLKKHIITRNFKINNIEVETEKSVSVLASELSSNGEKDLKELSKDKIKKVIAKCQDRIDIFIRCNIEVNDEKKELQIIIENKIDSTQGGQKNDSKIDVAEYTTASQTNRYYMATASNEKLHQLYVYLLPESSDFTKNKVRNKADDIKNQIIKEGKDDKKRKLQGQLNQLQINDNFIEIYYQDIVDGIVVPMLASSTLSTRERFFLEELKTELTFPSLESSNVRNSIALSNENVKKFLDIWNRQYKYLIIDSAIIALESSFWRFGNAYQIDMPKDLELVSRCLAHNYDRTKEQKWITTDGKREVVFNNEIVKFKANKRKEIISFANRIGLNVGIVDYSEDVKTLLNTFWDNNQRFLLAFMDAIITDRELPQNEKEIISQLLTDSKKRDRTKYNVYYGDRWLNGEWLDKKPANNAETAWLIIKAWIELDEGKSISLSDLNEKFNKDKPHTYYKSGKWLKNLFHQFKDSNVYIADGEDNKGALVEAGGWDFYKPKDSSDKKFRISTTEGDDYAIMLKMWRKDGLQRLIDLVTDPKNEYFEEGTLTIQPDK